MFKNKIKNGLISGIGVLTAPLKVVGVGIPFNYEIALAFQLREKYLYDQASSLRIISSRVVSPKC